MPDAPARHTSDAPARGSLPHRATTRIERSGRTIAGLVVAAQVLVVVVSLQLSVAAYLDEDARSGVHLAEVVAVCLYVVVALAALAAWRARRHRLAVRLLAVYLAVLTLQLVVYVLLLVVGMGQAQDEPLWYLGDLVSVLLLDVAVFAAWYWIVDCLTPNGAFSFPPRADADWEPGLVDYVFLSFNTTATFGPTTEMPVDARSKVAMMVQTTLALAVLIVLASRIVSRV
jgi:hypothetical protein